MNTQVITDHAHALSMAKILLMSRPDSAFLTTICFSLKFVWDESISTAAVNDTTMYINPKFFLELPKEERVFVLVHECLHVALLHIFRGEGLCPDKFNQAADHVINLMLLQRGFKMPDWVLKDPQYTGMSTEEVYALLPKPGPNDSSRKMGQDIKSPEAGDKGKSKEEQIKAEQAVQDILIRAAMQSKIANDKIGTIPGEIQIYLNGLLNPKLPWNRILQKYLQATAKHDYSFRKPNRRFFPKYHLPSLHSESLMSLAIAVDASGSVSDHDFTVFASEVHGILKMMKPESITLVQFDTDLKSIDKVNSVQELSQLTFTGRGGTDIHPVLEWANTKKPQLLLIFTDGYFKFTDVVTTTPVLWIVHNNPGFVAPFGKVIHYAI